MTAKIDYFTALQNALSNLDKVQPEQPQLCCRVYVGVDHAHKRGMKAAAKKVGIRFLDNPYGCAATGALYVGYDNMDGDILAKGNAIVARLSADGIPCWQETVLD